MKRDLQRMMILFFALVFSLSQAFSQAPANYYSSTNDLSGVELKVALHNIIKAHTTFPYTSSGTDVWDILKLSDRDPANPANVILFYTGWSVNAAQEYANGAGWNREHVWAKSHGPFSEDVKGPGTDCHALRPCDVSVNSARNNRHFDYGDFEYLDGIDKVPTGCKTSSARDVWEPRDVEKGDVARMIFYMATRYEGGDGFPDLEVVDYFPASSAEPKHAFFTTLMEWNKIDTVDSFEMNRNNVVYSYQKNRNPFVDHPEFIDLIWGPPVIVENLLPQIANISYSPSIPTSSDILRFTADASDTDGTVQSVRLYWGLSADNLLNYSEMVFVDNEYTASLSPQTAGSEIFFAIEAFDNDDAKSTSEVQNFSIGSVNTSISTVGNPGFIYPNPASSTIRVEHKPSESVNICTSSGKILIQTRDNTIDIAHLSKGLYLVQIVDEAGRTKKSGKIIKE